MIIKKITWQLTILIILFFALIFLPNPLIEKIKGTLIIPIKYPLILTNDSSENVVNFFNYRNILKENKELKRKLDLLKREMTKIREAQLESERLHKLLDFKQKYPHKTVAAEVIGKDSSNWVQTIIINKGKKHNIKKGTVVLTYSGLIGKVIEAADSTSKIILITDPSLKVAAKIQRTRDEGIVEGAYKDLCRIKYLPLESKILKGDKVITSGFSQFFPPDLLIGRIISVDRDPSNLYQIAIIKPEVDLLKLEEVLCIEKKKSF